MLKELIYFNNSPFKLLINLFLIIIIKCLFISIFIINPFYIIIIRFHFIIIKFIIIKLYFDFIVILLYINLSFMVSIYIEFVTLNF